MAKGWNDVEQQTHEVQAQRERFEATSGKPLLIVNARNPGPYVIRFLEQGGPQDPSGGVNSYPVHDYKEPAPVQGGFRNKRFTCLSEIGMECPGCKAGLKRKVRGVFNVIQRNRPVFQRGQDNKVIKDPSGSPIIVGHEDTVAIASVGGPTAEMLRKADTDYRGLMSRDFQVTYTGDTFQAWNLIPVMDDSGNAVAMPMSQNDMALAAKKHNLDEFMKPPTIQEAAQIVARYGGNSRASPNAQPPVGGMGGSQGTAGMAPGPANGFLAGAPVPAVPGTNAFGQTVGVPAAPAAPAVPAVPSVPGQQVQQPQPEQVEQQQATPPAPAPAQ